MSTDIEGWQGGCLCGSVRFRLAGQPLTLLYCHCRMCQRAGGAPVVAWATVPVASLAWSGTSRRIYRSSPEATRAFCGECGSPLAFQSDAEPDRLDLTIAAFDRADLLAPDHHVWVSSRLPWFETQDRLPRHPAGSES